MSEWLLSVKQVAIYASKGEEQGKYFSTAGGVQIGADTMEISMAFPQEDENWCALRYNYSILGNVPKGCFILPQRHLLNHIYCCSIHNNPKLEPT